MPGTSIVQKLQIKPNRTALFVDSREVDRDGIASYAKTIGMRAAAQIAVVADRPALRFKTV